MATTGMAPHIVEIRAIVARTETRFPAHKHHGLKCIAAGRAARTHRFAPHAGALGLQGT